MTEAQEKNHTDPIQLSSRTPLGQLMPRAVTYTHQAGADGSTTPLPPEKNSHYFWVPPHMPSLGSFIPASQYPTPCNQDINYMFMLKQM